MIRSFIAVDINDPDLLANIRHVQQSISRANADLKLVEGTNLHLTLRFFGEITNAQVEQVCDKLTKLRFQPITLTLRGIGVFPGNTRISVIWVGIDDGAKELHELKRQLQSALKNHGIPSNSKKFSPHLTLARVRSGRNKDQLIQIVNSLSEFEVGKTTVDSISLKKSILTSQGPVYTTICECKVL